MKMKKTAVVLAAVAAMAMSSVCSASIGSQLDKYDKASTNFVNAISQKDTDLTYESLAGSFSDGLKKNLTSAEYMKLQKQVSKDFGQLQDVNFNAFVKRVDQNNKPVYIVTYLCKFAKVQYPVAAQFVYEESGKILNANITILQPPPEQKDQAQASQPAEAAQ